MEVIVWIIATISMMVAYAIAEIRIYDLRKRYNDALHDNFDLRYKKVSLEQKDIVLEAKCNRLDKVCHMYHADAVEIAREKADIVKYTDYLISRYEEVYEEKRKLEWQNERLREQVEFFERELATEEGVKNAECRVQNAE